MLRRVFLLQALLATGVVAGLTATHFVLNRLHPEAANVIFVIGLGVALVVLLISTVVVGRGIARILADRDAAHLGTIASLAAAIEASDEYTGEHSDAVEDLVVDVGRRLALDDSALRELRLAAALHDVGKIGIPKEILHKAGPLNDAEWVVMRRHPEIGARILEGVPGARDLRLAILHEHEHWDGSGYPDGLAGPAIPLMSRIVLACDAFHAMTSDRPYRKALPRAEAIRRLREAAGVQFDPTVVDAVVAAVAHTDDASVTAA